MRNSSEQRTEDYIAQIERYENSSLVRDVLTQDTSFFKEVEDFYNLNTGFCYTRLGRIRTFEIGEADSQKTGKYPEDLIKTLDIFGENSLDASKLKYDSVREDYQKWNHPLRRTKGVIKDLGGMLIGTGGFAACIFFSTRKWNPEIAVPAGVIGIGGLVAYFWPDSKPNGSNDELGEYIKLCEHAENADGFIDERYRNFFIRKTLSNS